MERRQNRLAAEASPYLLQHAHNPVDWWPWSDEALAEAKRRDVPILLSIGYSACHWCHVMERESFEDEAIAKLMNEKFVNIKVDREERPDLDQIYQLVVQLLGRSGGWPLTVFLTPDQKPFFGGTYFPPKERYGMASFPQILDAISSAYHDKRDEVVAQSAELTDAIAKIGEGKDGDNAEAYSPAPDLLARVSRPLLRRFDEAHGGFGQKPKFPNTMPLELLLRRGVLEGDGAAKDAARLQLVSMREGGIWDHLGGGFHRYSTDERWLVPHFEKMLYDNALLLRAYVDGFRTFGTPLFAETAREVAAYVAREMTDGAGGFYASQDADSEGEEGKFFVWDPAEVEAEVAAADAPMVLDYFGVTEVGNFEEHGTATGKSVLHVSRPLSSVAAKYDESEANVRIVLARATKAMFEAREKRPKPFRDEKVLTSWSALMIGALAEAGAALAAPEMITAAARALAFLREKLVDATTGRVGRLVKGDVVKPNGFLDDHAYLANAALDLYEVTGDVAHVTLARTVTDAMLAGFFDPQAGFYFTPKDGESLITRSKDAFDHAVPSGFAMACRALLRLGAMCDGKYTALGEAQLVAIAPAAVANPFAYGQSLCEIDRLVRGSVDVVLVGARDDARTRALAHAVFARWLPNRNVVWIDPAVPATLEAVRALAEGKPAKDHPVAYVCRGRACSLPVATPEALSALL